MTTRIKLHDNVFDAGKPLNGVNPSKVRVQVGKDEFNAVNGVGLGIVYVQADLNKTVDRSSITVTQNPIEVDDTQVDRWSQHLKNALADLIDKQVVVVERPLNTPLTSAAVRAL